MEVRIIIAGGRDFVNYDLLKLEAKRFILENGLIRPITIVSGCANGADKLGERFATEYNFFIDRFPADWDQFNKRAGPIRNEQMAQNAKYCLVFWDGVSKGSANMIENAKKYNLIYKVIKYD